MGEIAFFVLCYKKSVKFLTITDKRKIIITMYIDMKNVHLYIPVYYYIMKRNSLKCIFLI